MMRSVWGRLTALFVGLWFVAVTAAPELTHACPMHGAHAAAAAPAPHGNHAAPASAQSAAAHHSSTDTDSNGGNQCTCLGHCCGAATVALVADAIALIETTTAATRDAGLPNHAYVPVAAQHVLPLAHAPPLSA
jgi:hypothetical protein